jgi:tRNA-2-methylthio-N6-dimethylallyladenosine synthase
MFSFKYSERPQTLAEKRMPDTVSESEKALRLRQLQDLQKGIQKSLHEREIGLTVKVLVDSHSRRRIEELSGRTSGNTVVNFPGKPEWIGRTLDVHVKKAGPNSLWGEVTAP